jgi:hypothetical protein
MFLPIIEPDQLQPCDVLQFNGNSFVNKAIQILDAGQLGTHNHSAQWTGKGVAGALARGYVEVGLEEAITDTDVFVDVIRFCGDRNDMPNTQLGSPDYPFEPVLEQINLRLSKGLKYNYPDILLLAGLGEIRRLTNPSIYERVLQDQWVRNLLDGLINGSVLLKLIQDAYSNGQEMDICSQAVYSNFASAGEKYRPTVLPESMHNVFRSIIENKISESVLISEFNEVKTAESGLPTSFITPHDLWMSPNFCMNLGRLKYGHLKTDL